MDQMQLNDTFHILPVTALPHDNQAIKHVIIQAGNYMLQSLLTIGNFSKNPDAASGFSKPFDTQMPWQVLPDDIEYVLPGVVLPVYAEKCWKRFVSSAQARSVQAAYLTAWKSTIKQANPRKKTRTGAKTHDFS
ncbi:MAG: hypothetical protein KDK51_09735 [Deltaproteobacteria bacterium]|nr:hypothetical protein [Deltaproteobacteria bacterium]